MFLKKFIAALLVALLCIACLAGCKKEEPKPTYNDNAIWGTWSEDFFDSGYIFNDDGTGFDTFWNLSFTYTADGERLCLIYDDELWGESDYSYTISGNTLTMIREVEEGETADEFVYTRQGGSQDIPDETSPEGEGEGGEEEPQE